MPSYRRVHPDHIPESAVIVSLWRATGRTVADIVCTSCPKADEYIVAEFPRPVPIALQRAEELREACGLKEVIVICPDLNLWKPDWGRLVDEEHEPVLVHRSTSRSLYS